MASIDNSDLRVLDGVGLDAGQRRRGMTKRSLLLGCLLATAAALPFAAAPKPAAARVFVGVGVGVPLVAPVPVAPYPYYYPPAVYAPPVAYAPPASVARCLAGPFTCPLPYAKPIGAACGCPDGRGSYVGGRTG